jgi:Sulfotransferase family
MTVSSRDAPTFIIGGAPRSGTTYLCHALDRHPDVYIAKPYVPEPKVFIGPPKPAESYRARYAELFAGSGDRRALGEKTSTYFESEVCCERIATHLPEVRVLFIVREPVARAYSNYLWSTKNGLETLGFEEAIALEGQRPSPLPAGKEHARPFDYLARGDYATFAEWYYALLGRERVAFFLYEDIEARPEILFSQIARFLDLKPIPPEQFEVGVINSAREQGPAINSETEQRLRRRVAPLVQRFAAVTGLDVRPWGYDTRDQPSPRPLVRGAADDH